MKLAVSRKRAAGFTLIELVISSALMSIILVSGYLCLNAGVVSERLINTRSEAAQSARVALAMMAADLRSAVPLWRETEFMGMRRKLGNADADNVDFGTRNYSPRKPGELDFCEVSYFLRKDPDSDAFVLFRRRDVTPDPEPLQGGQREEIARGLRGLRIEYYDGWDWYDEWGDPEGKQQFSSFPEPNASGLPEAVRVTLTFDPEFEKRSTGDDEEETPGPPLVFQTVARVNLSLFFYQRSSGSRTSSSEESPTNGESRNGGGAP